MSATTETRSEKTLLALLSQPWWVVRTVETVTLVDRHTARRRISRHFTLPPESCRAPCDGNHGMLRLPLFGIPKAQHLSCDLLDEHKGFVSLPPLSDRADLSAGALCHLAGVLGGNAGGAGETILRELVSSGPQTSELRLRQAEEETELAPLFADPHFRYLATYLARNWVVYVDVPDETETPSPNGHIIRFALDVRFPHTQRELRELRSEIEHDPASRPFLQWGVRRRRRLPRWVWGVLRGLGIDSTIYHHVVRVDGAGSLHLELESMDGIALAHRHLRFKGDGPDRRKDIDERHPGASSRRARFLIPRVRGPGDAVMTVAIRPGPGVLRNGAPILLLAMAVLLALAAMNRSAFIEKSQAVAIIFLLPGLVSLVAARPNEHPYVTGVVLWIRMLAILPILLGMVAAVVLITAGPEWILWAGVGVSALASALLAVGRAIDELQVKPDLNEYVAEDLTRIG